MKMRSYSKEKICTKHGPKCLVFVLMLSFLFLGLSGQAESALIFSDDFNSVASSQWGNEIGNWAATGGVYNAGSPGNNPTTYTSLPNNLVDLTFDVTINNISDGGIWLHSTPNGTSQPSGVLLVTLSNEFYWHVVNGTIPVWTKFNPQPASPQVTNNVRVIVSGNTYSAYLNGTLITTLTDSTFASGRVALYDFSGQTFDNVKLYNAPVPIPPTVWLLGSGLIGFIGLRRKFTNYLKR
jgi:hypothetical protein